MHLRDPRWSGALFYFGLWASYGSYGPFLNVYFADRGITGFQIGLLSAISPLTALIFGPLLSALADRRHWQKRMLLLSILSGVVTLLLLMLPMPFGLLAFIVLLRSVSSSPMMPIADGLIVRMAARHHIDYGRLRLWGSLSFALFTIGCGALWEQWGFNAMFITAAGLSLFVLLAALLLEFKAPVVVPTVMGTTTPTDATLLYPAFNPYRDRALVALLIAMFLVGIAEGMYGTFSGVYMDHLGGGETLVGTLFGLSALCELPVMHYSGTIFRKLGKSVTVLLAYGLVGISLIGFALSRWPVILLLFAMLKGVGFALYFVGNVSLVDERAPESWTSTLQSLMTAASRGLAPLLTVPLAGWLADSQGLPAVFTGGGLAALLAAGVIVGAVVSGAFRDKVEIPTS